MPHHDCMYLFFPLYREAINYCFATQARKIRDSSIAIQFVKDQMDRLQRDKLYTYARLIVRKRWEDRFSFARHIFGSLMSYKIRWKWIAPSAKFFVSLLMSSLGDFGHAYRFSRYNHATVLLARLITISRDGAERLSLESCYYDECRPTEPCRILISYHRKMVRNIFRQIRIDLQYLRD